MKKRLDQLLIEKKFAESQSKAQAMILSGNVLVNEQRIDKPGQTFEESDTIRLKEVPSPYVGRGGFKLEAALEYFHVEVAGKTCLDVGASTGGFTDCLLQRGATKVYAVDVGYGQLDSRLRKDSRVVVLERENIRHVTKEKITEPIEIMVVDVSFISLKTVLPFLPPFLAIPATVVALIKPQFEVGKKQVGKGGIVTNPALHKMVTIEIQKAGEKLNWNCLGVISSPILGAEGNKEFLIAFSIAVELLASH